jgi:hypothetical protein
MARFHCLVFLVPLLLAACGKPPTAMEACTKLEAVGVAAKCRPGKPGGLGANASEKADFDLPSVPDKGGAVYGFDTDEAYESTVKSFDGAKVLAGPHRYGNEKRRIFVQFNDGASMDVGAKAKTAIADL